MFPADQHGCGWYRLIYPAHVLADDLDIALDPDIYMDRWESLLGDIPARAVVDADVVIFQRPMKRELAEAIPILQRQGIAVVVEVDDDFHALPTGHPTRRIFAPMHNPDRNWRWLAKSCEMADLVTVSTPALAARYGAHERVVVLPNCIPEAYLSIVGKPNDRSTIGWTGTPMTHVGDLEVTGNAVRHTLTHTGAAFRAIGSPATLDVLRIEGEVVEWCDLTDLGPDGYPATVASLDVGIVPLAANDFNCAKSNIKGAEYAALGVPFVASPLPEYEKLGAGVLADNEGEWRRCLTALVSDETLRADVVGRGREVAAEMTYEKQAWRWGEAWQEALMIRQGKRAA